MGYRENMRTARTLSKEEVQKAVHDYLSRNVTGFDDPIEQYTFAWDFFSEYESGLLTVEHSEEL